MGFNSGFKGLNDGVLFCIGQCVCAMVRNCSWKRERRQDRNPIVLHLITADTFRAQTSVTY